MVDIQEMPEDRALEWLPMATDAEALRQRLAPWFAPLHLVQLKVERLTYKPGRSARFSYRLKLVEPVTGEKWRHVLHGRMEPAEEMAALYKKMRKRAWVEPRFGPALIWFEDLCMLLWGFPNDPKLHGIERVAQPEGLRETLRAVPALGFQPERCDSSIVKYVPGKRLVMRHKLAAGRERATIYSKTYSHERGAAIHAVMRHLWERAQREPEALTLPEPLAWLPECNTLLLRGLPGTAAIGELHGPGLQRCMQQAGRGLAHIHTSGVLGLERWGEAHELENFLGATGMLQRWDADLAAPVARLRALAEAGLATLERCEPVSIHGAFRFTQLLSYRDRLALVDFDGFKQGHPMCDAGGFVAHLFYLMAKGELEPAAARTAVAAFLDAYAETAACAPRALHWYTALILVGKHAQKCVKRLKDDGDTKIRVLLDVAENLLVGRLSLR
jgi:hypothetical protein